MDDLAKLAAGLAAAPTAWMLAVCLLAIAYLFRQLTIERKERLEMVLKQEAAHRESLDKLYPAIQQLKDASEIVQRFAILSGKKE